MAKLRSQNGLGQNWLLLCQESHTWFSFSGDPLPYVLTFLEPCQLWVSLRGIHPFRLNLGMALAKGRVLTSQSFSSPSLGHKMG